MLSVLLVAMLIVYNYQQLEHPFMLLERMPTVTNELNRRSTQTMEIQKLQTALIERKLPAPANFERLYQSKSFSHVYFVPKDAALLEGWEFQDDMIENERMLEKLSISFNKIKFDETHYEASLQRTSLWATRMIEGLVEQKNLYAQLSEHLSEQLMQEAKPILWVNGSLLFSIMLLLFGAPYIHLRTKLLASNELNEKLQGKQSNIIKTQRIMVSIMDDIKREKSRALELATQNQQLVSLVYQSSDAIFWLTESGIILNCNDATHRLFQRAGADLEGQAFKILFDTQDQAAIQTAIENIVDKAETSILHIRIKNADDQSAMTVLAASFSSLLDQENRVTGLSVIARDISSQYHEREQLRLIIDQAPTALIITDTTGCIAMCNQQVEKMFSYVSGELIGQPIEVLVPATIRAQHPALRHQFMREPTSRAMGAGRDLTGCKKDGSEVPIEIGLSPISTSEGRFVIASIVDITERRKSQKTLENFNEKLTQKNKEMEQFIYTVSHDLKSPLVTINAFSKKLYKELSEQLSDKQKHLLMRIQDNVAHMEQLLKDLLNLSHIIQLTVEKTWVDTAALLPRVLIALEEEINEAGAHLQVNTPLPSIYANESMLLQCLQNLLSNAIKYRDQNRITVIDIDIQHVAGESRLAIKDNGLGIDSKYHEQIFRIFERLGTGEGTGVGLSIVKTIMEKHNGHVILESLPGYGSTFTLCFPIPEQNTLPVNVKELQQTTLNVENH